MLRIEDTDQKRSSDASSMAFLEDLEWLGLGWDEGPEHEGHGGGSNGPYYQSERLAIYDRYCERLIEEGKAYRAFETPEELDAARERAKKEGRAFKYTRDEFGVDEATERRYLEEGRPHVVRFAVPPEKGVKVEDVVLGTVEVAPGEVDDFVIRKADGYPTYHFAVVVDDELMEVTHVLRGQEHLNNTPRHVLLQDALGFRRPVYAHLSIIMNPDGSKMSKRDKDRALRREVQEKGTDGPPAGTVTRERWEWWLAEKDHQLALDEAERLAGALGVDLPEINVNDFRRSGYLPEVLINYLALLGWSPGENREKFDRDFLVEHFSLERLLKSPAKFDRDKLLAFNLDAIQAMSAEAFARRLRAHMERYHPAFLAGLDEARFALLAASTQERSKTLEDPVRQCEFLVTADDAIVYEDVKPVRKALGGQAPSGRDHLAALLGELREVEPFSKEALEETITAYAEAKAEGKLGKVAQPLRVAVTGTTVSPPIFDTLAMLGRASVLKRIERCLETGPGGGD